MDEKWLEEAKTIVKELKDQIEINTATIENNELTIINSNKEFRKIRYLVISTLTFTVFTLLFIFTFRKFNNYINYFLIVLYSLAAGIYFWILRERYRLFYGILEIIVGLISIFLVFNSVDFNFAFFTWKFQSYMGIVGGLYILVRGIDNLSKTKHGKSFLNFFYSKKI